MIKGGTLLTCEIVLDRYLKVIAENPNCMTPEYKQMIADAAMDIKHEREHIFLGITNAISEVPTQSDQANLL